LVITDAERGSKVSDGKTVWRAGVFRERKLADRTGAGDAFGSGFVAGLMQKGEKCEKGICKPQNIAYALRLASANATSNIESIGAKSGILTKKGFQAKRWSRLGISYTQS
jgi:sugar/nucleoside kinase (ribokinase family)